MEADLNIQPEVTIAIVRQGLCFTPLTLLAARTTTLNICSGVGTSCPPEKLESQQLLLDCLLLLGKALTEEAQLNGNEPSGSEFFFTT